MIRIYKYIKDNRAKSISIFKIGLTLMIGLIIVTQEFFTPVDSINLLYLLFFASVFTTFVWHVIFSKERFNKTISMGFFIVESLLLITALYPLTFSNPLHPVLFVSFIIGIRFLLGGRAGLQISSFTVSLLTIAIIIYTFLGIIENPVFQLSFLILPALIVNALCSFSLKVISSFINTQMVLENEKAHLKRSFNNLKKELFLNTQIVSSLNKDVKRKNIEIKSILSLSDQLNINPDSNKAIESYLYTAIGQLGCRYAMVLAQNKRDNNYYSVVSVKGVKNPDLLNIRIYLNSNLLSTLRSAREPMLEKNIPRENLYADEIKILNNFTNDLFCPISIKGLMSGILIVGQKINNVEFSKEDINLISIIANQASFAMEQTQVTSEFQDIYFKTIKAMMKALEAKYVFARGHNTRTANYVNIISSKVGLSASEIKELTYGTLLHDVGKIAIRDKYLLDPHVFKEDQSAVKNKILEHTIKGATILKSAGFDGSVVDLALHHHENFDGSGYPHGISQNEIPIGVRILSVCNTFDAMTSDRPHRKALSDLTAKEFLEYNCYKKFDPQVVQAFLSELSVNKEMQKFH
jgi:putative nucleotidyltransferase with HDIG domain